MLDMLPCALMHVLQQKQRKLSAHQRHIADSAPLPLVACSNAAGGVSKAWIQHQDLLTQPSTRSSNTRASLSSFGAANGYGEQIRVSCCYCYCGCGCDWSRREQTWPSANAMQGRSYDVWCSMAVLVGCVTLDLCDCSCVSVLVGNLATDRDTRLATVRSYDPY